jgi:hypothetical protein
MMRLFAFLPNQKPAAIFTMPNQNKKNKKT